MSTPSDDARELEALLDFLKRSRGFDFSGYKRASLQRRIAKRMQQVGVESHEEYTRYLEAHPEEFASLFNTILINVTAFFRDELPWEFLRSDVIPRILAQKRADEAIRVWSAGCATGEEAYSLAITFAEAMGFDAFRSRVKIYASDVDEDALTRARIASYTERELGGVAPELLDKYFEVWDGRFTFRKDLRRAVIFGRNDLVQDAPISRIDLLVCRNTLMYFDAQTQGRILARFHFALNDGGFLLLGRAETLYTHSNLFTPVDLKRRIFVKVRRTVAMRDRVLLLGNHGDEHSAHSGASAWLRDAAFESGAIPQMVVDRNGLVVLVNEHARSLFGVATADIGRPLQDLELSYRPADLRSAIDRAIAERHLVALREIRWTAANAEERWLDVQVLPLMDTAATVLGTSITFTDITTTRQLQRQLEQSHQELEAAYEELQSTNEELETTNEELQSTVEELETTNEELQSTNEELETMNEELQSTNEELQTINDELRHRSEELNEVNAFLESVFMSLRGGVAVVDSELRVLVWSKKAEDLWGARQEETRGMRFLDLDIGLPVRRLEPAIAECLARQSEYAELELPATNRRGKAINCRVVITPLRGDAENDVRGTMIMMEEIAAAAPARPQMA
jgi:two-component system CheB/CheR fusion protein